MSLQFLEVLESRVREAAERLEELSAENATLKSEVEKRERDRSAAANPKPDRTADKVERAWVRERDEVRRRLEALIARLEALLP